MEWGSIFLVVEVLLLLMGWLLFQQAKSELTARAAEVPVLAEIKALRKSISELIEQLKLESSQASSQLEARCVEARDLLAALDQRLEAAQLASSRRVAKRRSAMAEGPQVAPHRENGQKAKTEEAEVTDRYQGIYSMADDGLDVTTIAQTSGYSEGEVELILGLRGSAR